MKITKVNKIAIISCVSGFYDVLQKTLDHIDKDWGKCTLVSIGHINGRGPESLKAIELIKNVFDHTILSIGDKRVLDSHPDVPLVGSPYLAKRLKVLLSEWTQETRDWLGALPRSKQVGNILFEMAEDKDIVNHIPLFKSNYPCLHACSSEEQIKVHNSLKERKLHCVCNGDTGVHIREDECKLKKIVNDFDFKPSYYGNVIVPPRCNIQFRQNGGYMIYDIEENTFHIRFIKPKKNVIVSIFKNFKDKISKQ